MEVYYIILYYIICNYTLFKRDIHIQNDILLIKNDLL